MLFIWISSCEQVWSIQSKINCLHIALSLVLLIGLDHLAKIHPILLFYIKTRYCRNSSYEKQKLTTSYLFIPLPPQYLPSQHISVALPLAPIKHSFSLLLFHYHAAMTLLLFSPPHLSPHIEAILWMNIKNLNFWIHLWKDRA